MKMSVENLYAVRARCDEIFSPETAFPGAVGDAPSSGHCAVVALLVKKLFGGECVSTMHEGRSHWFNRIGESDVDLAGDQFGRAKVTIEQSGKLFQGTRVRSLADVSAETWVRSHLFEQKFFHTEK